MNISMYQASIPLCIKSMSNLARILEKGMAHVEARSLDPSVLINARLYPDMFPLSRQVQIATDVAKGCASRLAGLEPPKFEDNEQTFDELKTRVGKTIAHLETFSPAQIDGSEDRTISFTVGGRPVSFRGLPYLVYFVLPNVYFHVTTTYAILRHNGVELGKMDFLGDIQ